MYYGDILAGETIYIPFNTVGSTGAPITLAGSPAITVYKNELTTANSYGVTIYVDHNSVTGFHMVKIDSDLDWTFFSAGSDFTVVISSGTVDGTSVVGSIIGNFSIENRSLNLTADPYDLDMFTRIENIIQSIVDVNLIKKNVPLVYTNTNTSATETVRITDP